LADGSVAFAGVPLTATDGLPLNSRSVIAVIVAVLDALVPPCVVTVIGPYGLAPKGTVTLTVVPAEKTSGPWLEPLASRTLVPPNR